jgi:tRNA (guanosine-2'-O-)-methyltransferase
MKSRQFDLTPEIKVNDSLNVHFDLVLKHIAPVLTASRLEKIKKISSERVYDVAVVLEGIYDRGNISAVMRTAEALGFINFHVIETQEKFKEANRVTQGSDKWVEVRKWKTTSEAIQHFKKNNIRICVTTLEGGRPIDEVDFNQPCAFVLGNEKEGASREIIEAADERVFIPMHGFVQSFNISVAGALGLYHIQKELLKTRKNLSDLSLEQQNILQAHYYMRSLDSAKDTLKELFDRNKLQV